MSSAISLQGGSSAVLKNVRIEGFDVGVEADNASSFSAENLSFDDVGEPFRVGADNADIRGTRITNSPHKRGNAGSFVGYRKARGAPLPAYCPSCKTVFPSANYNVGSSRFYSFDNEETCPKCGDDHAKVGDGLYDTTADIVRIVRAPDFTHAMAQSLRTVLSDMRQGKIEPEEAIERIETFAPSLGEVLRRFLTNHTVLTYVGLIMSAAALYYGGGSDTYVTNVVSNTPAVVSDAFIQDQIFSELGGLRIDLSDPSQEPEREQASVPADDQAPKKRAIPDREIEKKLKHDPR